MSYFASKALISSTYDKNLSSAKPVAKRTKSNIAFIYFN